MWPLVGRREELELVLHALDDPSGAGALLAGAPGVGKTRLVREALVALRARGCATDWVGGLSSTELIPLGAYAHLLPRATLGPNPDRLQLLRWLVEDLRQRGRGGRLVLGIDDAHLLDEASAALTYELAATRAVLLLATVRVGEPAPAPIGALWQQGLVARIDLQVLAEAEADQLLRVALGADLDELTRQRLCRLSAGNPLLLQELVLDALASGALDIRLGVARLVGPLATGSRLTEIVQQRLAALDVQERDALELLACGEPLGVRLLEQLVGSGVVERLERRRLVEVRGDGRRLSARVSHPLYAEALRARIPPLSYRAHRRRLADALQSTGWRRRDDLLRLATWRVDAGGDAGPDVLLRAARRSLALFDFGLAERLARAATDAGGGFMAEHALAEALAGQGRAGEADVVLRRLTDAAQRDEDLGVAALARAANLFWRLGQPEASEAVLSAAGARLTSGLWSDRLLALRASILLFYRPTSSVLDLLADVWERAERDGLLLVECLVAACPAWAFAGQTTQALAMIERGLAAAPRTGDGSLSALQLACTRWWALWQSGDLIAAEALGRVELDRAREQAAGEPVAVWSLLVGYSLLLRGRAQQAASHLRPAAAALAAADRWGFRSLALAVLAQSEALRGKLGDAVAALTDAAASKPRCHDAMGYAVSLARAWVAAARGELSAARAAALEAAALTRALEQPILEAVCLHDAARLGERATSAARLTELQGLVDGTLVALLARHARALAADDGHELDGVAGAFERMGAELWAAEAAAEAAHAYRRAGRRTSAALAAGRSMLLGRACGGVHTPGLALLGVQDSDELTDREREIALLAAGGLSSREIAVRLVVSVRTVDNHLQQVYGKLGVRRRTELGATLGLTS